MMGEGGLNDGGWWKMGDGGWWKLMMGDGGS